MLPVRDAMLHGAVSCPFGVTEHCDRLSKAEKELTLLREQNRLLRESAEFFAGLSERLNQELRLERMRRGPDGTESQVAVNREPDETGS